MKMDPRFREVVDSLHGKFEQLTGAEPFTAGASLPQCGVYLFTENGVHLYVGRSNNIPGRRKGHFGKSALHNSAPFAMRLARAETGRKASFIKGQGNKAAMIDEVFRTAFDAAKERIGRMEFRAVEETDQVRQTLLEVYCAVVLTTPHNDFGTH